MNCPRCSIDLQRVQVAGIEIEICGECKGVWFDNDELDRIFNIYGSELGQTQLAPVLEGEGVAGEAEGQNELGCPRCKANLARRKYDSELSVLVDGCEKGCGLWLDAGELTEISEHISKKRNLDNPEFESDMLLKTVKTESEIKNREKKAVDDLVFDLGLVSQKDKAEGLAGKLGLALRGIYKSLYTYGRSKD